MTKMSVDTCDGKWIITMPDGIRQVRGSDKNIAFLNLDANVAICFTLEEWRACMNNLRDAQEKAVK